MDNAELLVNAEPSMNVLQLKELISEVITLTRNSIYPLHHSASYIRENYSRTVTHYSSTPYRMETSSISLLKLMMCRNQESIYQRRRRKSMTKLA